MALITSRSNSTIKQLRALRRKKERLESGLFLAEGIRHVGEAVDAGAPLEAIVYAPTLLNSEYARNLVRDQAGRGVTCHETTAEVFESLAEKENPQGILAVIRIRPSSLDDFAPVNFSWGAALVAPQDPGNVGSILRTVDAVGADGLLLLDSDLDIYHPAAVRASMGSIFWKPVVHASFSDFHTWSLHHHYHVIGTSAHGEVDYLAIKEYPRPSILLLGSEREGLASAQREICESLVRLPMRGRATSLNLSVAAGILLYAMMEGSP